MSNPTLAAKEKESIDTLSTNPNATINGDSEVTKMTSHKENHSNSSILVGDIIIGFADGLTVPFALTAGLSSIGSLNLVILGGLAELFAGSISMGLGAFLAAATERKR
jgi:VIT1/CCC1 family predicted Fe2+/Mn2+ transporter